MSRLAHAVLFLALWMPWAAAAMRPHVETTPLGDRKEITLPDGTRHLYERDAVLEHANGTRSWVGKHRDLGNRHRAIVTTGPHGSYGVLSTPSGDWRIVPGPGGEVLVDPASEPQPGPLGNDVLVPPEAPQGKRALFAPSSFIPREGVDVVPRPKSTPTPTYDVDLMIAYTRRTAESQGAGLETWLQFLVDRTNTALADSEIAVRLRLVRTVQVDYDVANSRELALNAVTPSSSLDQEAFGHIEAMRAASGADLVLLIRYGNGGGVAWLGVDPPNAAFAYAFAECVGSACEYTVAHELGHSLGVHHDRGTRSWEQGGSPSPVGGVRPYAFGYAYCGSGTFTCNPEVPPSSGGCASMPFCGPATNDDFRDIMAYFVTSPLVFKYSNSHLTCAGPSGIPFACGVPAGQPRQADAAQAVNEYRPSVSGIKPTVDPPPPPATFIRFAANVYTAIEGSNVTLTVERQGNPTGSVQVSYRTYDATALAGSDYTATNGVLSWADGDATPRTITVPVLADGAAEDNEYFVAQLFEPSGTAEAYVDGLSKVPVIIAADWPAAASALPAGFVNSGSGPWTVASGVAYEGTTSLASAAVRGSGPSVSQLDYTADFPDGYVTFAYRTSMAPHPHGLFDFWIDGSLVFQVGGEADWKLYRIRVKAGRHTLRWRAANFESSPCTFYGGSSECQDRAWIDLVALPIGAAPPPGTAPQFTSPASTTFFVGLLGSFQFLATGDPRPVFDLGGGPPIGMSFSSSGVLSGVPAPGTAARYTYTAKALNGVPPDAQQVFTVDVKRQGQAITFAALADRPLSQSPFGVSATASSGLAVQFSSLTAATCTVSGNTVTLVAAGTCSIAADQGGNGTFTEAPRVTRSFTVTGGSAPGASITLTSSPNPSQEGADVTLTAPLTGTGPVPTGTVSFRDGSDTIPRCSAVTIEAGQGVCITNALAAGTHTLSAVYSGDATYPGGATASVSHAVTAATPGDVRSVSFSATALSFGAQSMGTTSPPQAITVTNTGNATVTFGAIIASTAYAATHDCGALAAGLTCTITVAFAPQAMASAPLNGSAAVDGALEVSSDAASSPDVVNLSGTAEKSLVSHFYRSILRRAPDAGGHDFWRDEAARVAALGANPNEAWFAMATAFYSSLEYTNQARTDDGFVTDLYVTFFNRQPDTDGKGFWLSNLAQGMPREVALAEFMFSAEFRNFTQAIFGNTAARAEVDMAGDFYRGLLARLPDDGGFTFWLGRFRQAQCAGAAEVRARADDVSAAFTTGPEYSGRGRTNAQYVGDLYNAFLRRGGDVNGVNFWINALDTGTSREQVRQAFRDSPEFSNRVDAVIQQGCNGG